MTPKEIAERLRASIRTDEYDQTRVDALLLESAALIDQQAAEIERLTAERDMARAVIKSCQCPGGGWTGMPDIEPTVKNCMAHDACGCNLGDALRNPE